MDAVMKGVRGAVVLALVIAVAGCGKWKRTAMGTAIGAGAGGAAGALIGHAAGNTAVGAIMGAAVGGAAGAAIGNYMDRQAAEMQRDLEGATVERVGEGIKITFASGILFPTNSADVQPAARENVQKLAGILNKYKDTKVLVEGHTDSTGTAQYNQGLSERRAASVASVAEGFGVQANRFQTVGYGFSQPVALNDTPEHKALNRRVEIAVFANERLKEAAQQNRLPATN